MKGDLLSFMVAPGNFDEREPLRNESFIELIFGKMVGDMEYISTFFYIRLILYMTNKTILSITIKFKLVQVEGGCKKRATCEGRSRFYCPHFLESPLPPRIPDEHN